LVFSSGKFALQASEPAGDNVDLGVGKSVREARVDFGEPRFRLRQRRAAGRRQPEPPCPPVIRISPPFDQVRRRHPVHQPADARRAEIERRARLAHQHAITLAQHEQQPGLRGRDPALLSLHRDPTLQPALRDAEQENQSMLASPGQLKNRRWSLFRMRTIYVSTRRLSTMVFEPDPG
jgi:hypothetical protein